ncbi:uncharacterized protein LOC132181298 isoform X2 [Corylus avellana]|uniref:uncharacterized protein LOC132181298 isoform X2 n=1 Tax=Corylus avellana TaxID=13451 RepID=UPI00286D0031|nr:uncharacterized protein LOC132181298 isoform X2 [Corylus avellana]
MSSQHKPTTNTASPNHSLSFDHISNYFSLPLNDAASNLGVCTSVLKKICRDNGLDRWPYRKFLSGKSIEEIKRNAARERYKELAEMSKIGRESGSQQPNSDMTKLQGATLPHNLQQQGAKNIQNVRPQNLLGISLPKGITILDEFKYGYPSDGLSTASNKWWGSSSPVGCEGIFGDGAETNENEKHQSEEMVADSSDIVTVDKENHEGGKEGCKIASQGMGLLTTVRKRTMEEGREALKLGVFRGCGINKVGKRERTLLLRIFKSSLPKRWINGSS